MKIPLMPRKVKECRIKKATLDHHRFKEQSYVVLVSVKTQEKDTLCKNSKENQVLKENRRAFHYLSPRVVSKQASALTGKPLSASNTQSYGPDRVVFYAHA